MTADARPRVNPALRLAAIRQIHVYLGVVIAPSVLFFATTGALQLFSLHEAHGSYHPPAIVEALASVHKDQVFETKPPEPPPSAEPAGRASGDDHHEGPPNPGPGHDHGAPKASTLVLKWLFLFVASGLVVSTCLGLWMALQYNRNKRLIWLLLLAGVLAPVVTLLV